MTDSSWLETTQAARSLGIAPCTLKRKRDINGGFLEGGKHYRFKTDTANSPVLWDVETIRSMLHERGMKARQEARADQVIRELQREGNA
ncbi:hypothetical protein SynBIOSE41_01083 [Synechococcus sp. BIOS-E4-1]|uniref:hypothetical protein n=1 Tax=unclassified Synechococcus TaxID=2626047 RepID=UPI0007BBCA6B|nr:MULTISPECIES: hypothetical protein [unclassified Synechococcus]KZR86521.1 hypothetical protein MITS9504_01121 [Synechococcus sp. MIT S9504]KZR92539.1 hypothetical protein MITS9509_01531 [Synechococcus sp. MIT S9509]QNI53604.1 hypothetical protein SynBIOSE41_01083 [Synechococcus sp. BIOS-E4-1]